ALPPILWVVDATRRAALTTLGRDQGIFQFIAWSLSRGAIDYRDVRDVNGPLIHLIHLVFLSLGGADEHRFHVLDLAVTGASFAVVGACAPSIGSSLGPAPLERALWALAGWVTLSGQYLLYGFWDIAQRESFLDWFMLPAIALQLVAQRPYSASERPERGRHRGMLFVLIGMLSVIPWFGKPTYALFTAAQLTTLVVDRRAPVPRRKALMGFAFGGLAGAATQALFLVEYGDPLAFLRIQLSDVPSMYRFMWTRSALDVLSTPFFGAQALLALTGSALLLALLASGAMPPRALGVALAPLCALGSVLAQAKGFPYHFHPVSAGVALQAVVLVAWLSDRVRAARRSAALPRLVPVALAIGLAMHVGGSLLESPYLRDPWLLTAQPHTGSSDYFTHFIRVDFFPDEMRDAAAYVRAHTRADESVQMYGMDPYLLFLADRPSATPYIYAYELNADAALAGGTGGRPDLDQTERIRRMRDAHEADLLARISVHPPGALVFVDGSPLLTRADAWEDFASHCARSAAWVEARYEEASRFGHEHVWLRKSPAASGAEAGNRK
ncbi:MAG TPA: hypothetical protein VEK07_07940, partial [Polyangiaceae bacterium]|nr:hypothetical protein [Polyangiaceae bacterium]